MEKKAAYTIEIATKEMRKLESGREAGRREKGQRKEGMVREKWQGRSETEEKMGDKKQ